MRRQKNGISQPQHEQEAHTPEHEAEQEGGTHRPPNPASSHNSHDHTFSSQREKSRPISFRNKPRDRRSDAQGLTVLYEPDKTPAADIVFVHGLGGSSRQTWSKNKDPELFWPQEWLPLESGLSDVRISTFGYNAHFASATGSSDILNISDFARDLLFRLRFATGVEERPLNIGDAPLIFVAHSMGGLVVKKAFILGQNDLPYQSLIRSLYGIVFLSTPHRGTDFANVMNRILSACLTSSSKQYIAELQSNSPFILEINEQFRHLAPKLNIVSFFETRKTTVGVSGILILQRDSSTLGYPGEISKHLDADHHDVCKFQSRQDPNYISVRDILKYLIAKARPPFVEQPATAINDDMVTIVNFLGNPEVPDDDLDFFAEKRLEGSCEWLLEDLDFTSWYESTTDNPILLWCNGKPGSGKSVVGSFVINMLQEQDLANSFYFFRSGAHAKNNLTMLLCSIALQIATAVPEYRRRLSRMYEDGVNIVKAAPRFIWQKLFLSALSKLSVSKPVFLIIDGLDEADTSPLFLKMLAELAEIQMPFRILLISRLTPPLAAAFDRLRKRVTCSQISLDSTQYDLQSYVVEEMEAMRGDEAFKEYVVARILEKAAGNFLWVHLVVKEILQCHKEDDVENALNQVPEDLGLLYERMDKELATTSKPSEQEMGRAILMWAACARYSLSLSELKSALQPEHPGIIDIGNSIQRTCGEFVVIDNKSRITMMHASAREYLTTNPDLRFFIDVQKAHQSLFARCLDVLKTWNTKARTDSLPAHSLLFYSITSWPFHLEESVDWQDQDSLDLLCRFFQQQSVLHWISLLAKENMLRILIQAAKVMTKFLKFSDRLDKDRSPLTHRIKEKEFLSLWVHDLIRIVAKFGSQIVRHPKAIFNLVPAFCPRQSMMGSQFLSKASPSAISVKGNVNSNWDDCLARFSLSGDSMPLEIKTLSRHFAAILADGTIKMFHSATCEEARTFHHKERILATCFNSAGDKMATFGFLRTKVWDTNTSQQIHSVENPKQAKALAITFDESGEILITCSDDSMVRTCALADSGRGWSTLPNPVCMTSAQSDYGNSPRRAQFNHDGSLLAVAYRAQYPSVWAINERGPSFLSECAQRSDGFDGRSKIQKVPTDAQKLCWNPLTGHILGVYNDGCIFKWHPFEDTYEFSTLRAADIECSADGKFFVTASANGMLRIFDFFHFTPVYSLSYAMSVTSLAIDRTEGRIYDVREQFCNVWEPNALLRLSETDETANDALSEKGSSTQASLSSEVSVENAEPLTALSLNPADSSYAVGDDGGILAVYDNNGDKQAELAERFMTIEHLDWSNRGHCLASADLSRVIMVDSLLASTSRESGRTSKTLLTVNEEDSIKQLALNSSGSHLLVATESFLKVWCVESKSLVSIIPTPKQHKWYSMNSSGGVVLGFGFETITHCSWNNITDLVEWKLNVEKLDDGDSTASSHDEFDSKTSHNYPMSPSDIENQVDKVLVSPDETLALVQTSQLTAHGKREKAFMLINIPVLLQSKAEHEVGAKSLAHPLRAQLEMALGFVTDTVHKNARRRSSAQSPPIAKSPAPLFRPASSQVLVFLSKDFWICTYDFGEGTASTVKRHFFLPRDWLNMNLLELARVTPDGRILCPRNGEVAIIENGLAEEWVD